MPFWWRIFEHDLSIAAPKEASRSHETMNAAKDQLGTEDFEDCYPFRRALVGIFGGTAVSLFEYGEPRHRTSHTIADEALPVRFFFRTHWPAQCLEFQS